MFAAILQYQKLNTFFQSQNTSPQKNTTPLLTSDPPRTLTSTSSSTSEKPNVAQLPQPQIFIITPPHHLPELHLQVHPRQWLRREVLPLPSTKSSRLQTLHDHRSCRSRQSHHLHHRRQRVTLQCLYPPLHILLRRPIYFPSHRRSSGSFSGRVSVLETGDVSV
uniref:Uncharacterized protein n=1 Tax=Brassica oleracea TaxID=3712 RepID=A0A3P6E5K2_BRAOL|nr:unnamed protein product [Brassica oleracea]